MPEVGDGVAALLQEARTLTDARLEAAARHLRAELPSPLGEAVAYALRTSGKRVRPALVLAAYRSVGGRSPAIGGLAAAVEVVHTYSLVHDDLPCMDDDDQRRGRPTTHVRFTVPIATRAGWVLVPVAVELLCTAAAELGLDDRTRGRLAIALLEASGLRGMVGGQWLDLEAEGHSLGVEALMAMHGGKTGALIRACCEVGGIAGGATPEQLEALGGYGREIGLAFQIADDVLDATATTEQLGKTAGRDRALGKSTYVSVLGIGAARADARHRADLALASLATAPLEAGPLEALAGYIITRSS